MSENFNSVVNFTIYKKLKILNILENKNPKLQSFNHSKQGKQRPAWTFFDVQNMPLMKLFSVSMFSCLKCFTKLCKK